VDDEIVFGKNQNFGVTCCGRTCVVVEHVCADLGITFVVRAPGQSVSRERRGKAKS